MSFGLLDSSAFGFFGDAVFGATRYGLAVVLCVLVARAPSSLSASEPIRIDQAQTQLIQSTVIPSQVAGVIADVHVSEGQWIESDQPLVTLEDSRATAERAAAKAAYEAARVKAETDVEYEYATRTKQVRQREYQQSQVANEQAAGSVPEIEMQRLRLLVEQAELSVEQAEHAQRAAEAMAAEKRAALHLAELRIAHHRVFAPFDGQVAERLAPVGSWVEVGGPLVRLISLNPIRVSGFVDGNRYDSSLVGAAAEFRWTPPDDEPIVHFAGRVSFVSDELNPITGEVKVWVELENKDRKLRPGMKGELRIDPSQR